LFLVFDRVGCLMNNIGRLSFDILHGVTMQLLMRLVWLLGLMAAVYGAYLGKLFVEEQEYREARSFEVQGRTRAESDFVMAVNEVYRSRAAGESESELRESQAAARKTLCNGGFSPFSDWVGKVRSVSGDSSKRVVVIALSPDVAVSNQHADVRRPLEPEKVDDEVVGNLKEGDRVYLSGRLVPGLDVGFQSDLCFAERYESVSSLRYLLRRVADRFVATGDASYNGSTFLVDYLEILPFRH